MKNLASDDDKISGNCFQNSNAESIDDGFCGDDAILDNSGATTVGNLCHFLIGDISSTDCDLEFFGSKHENKESSHLSYYGWSDFGNFEDVDRMFRSCDSTFGQGNATCYNELSWISSSSCAIDGSEDASKSGLTSSCSESNTFKSTLQPHEADMKFMPNCVTYLNPASNEKNVLNASKSTWILDANESASLGHSYYGNCLDANKVEATSKEQTMERSSDPSSMTPEEKIEKLCWKQQMQSSLDIDPQHEDFMSGIAFTYPDPVKNELHQIQGDLGGNGEIRVSIELSSGELDYSTIRDSSCTSSMLSDEETSFQQLQHVLEQLDIRTKLCIRDGLYRLAQNAEERHNFGNSNGRIGDGRDKSGVMTVEETNNFTEVTDVEADTNSIDRSIAHLLFCRPSDPANGSESHKSHTITHGSITSRPVIPEKRVCQEVAGSIDTKLPSTENYEYKPQLH